MILVTGGTGFLGEELLRRILPEGMPPTPVRVVARNEGKLIQLKEKFPSIEILTGDISDAVISEQAVSGDVRIIYHLAAFKHVGWAENQPNECIYTNIIGSFNLLNAAFLHKKTEIIMGISTDKAAQMTGVYGASKFLMEKIFQQFESFNPHTKYRIVRYGNVLYSTGSVLTKWKEALKRNEIITVTDLKATRFYWTVKQAVDLIFECVFKAQTASPYLPKMKSVTLSDLLDAMIEKYGDGIRRVKVTGLGPGENLHETMDGIHFSNECQHYTPQEIMEMI